MGIFIYGIVQVLSSGNSMQQAAFELQVVTRNIADGRTEEAQRTLALAQENTRSAMDKTDGPILWVGSKLPFIGDDVDAVRLVAEVMDGLSRDTLPDLLVVGGSLAPQSLQPEKGRVDVAPIRKVQPVIKHAHAEVAAALARVRKVEVDDLTTGLQQPMRALQVQLQAAVDLSRKGLIAAELLPSMLGGDGPRTYAVITQNNAEIRSTGGIPGAVAVVRADNGRVTMVRQFNETEGFGAWAQPVAKLTDEERALYEDLLGMYPQDVNLTPDFPRSAELLEVMWRKQWGEDLDGVISIDPVAMSYILTATGPLRVETGGVIEASKLVFALMNLTYIVQPNWALQDDVFASVGRAIFDAVVAGRGDPAELLDVLERSVDERRVMVWSTHPKEQALLDGSVISGDMPTEATSRPQVGLYLNDSASDKMSYYLDYKVDVKPRFCYSDGAQVLDVTATFASTAPRDIVERLGGLLVNPYLPGPELGSLRLNAHLYAPFGGRVLEATLDGNEAPTAALQHLGRQVTSVTFDVGPRQTRVVTYEVRTGPDQRGPVELRTTPAALGTGLGVVAPSACS